MSDKTIFDLYLHCYRCLGVLVMVVVIFVALMVAVVVTVVVIVGLCVVLVASRSISNFLRFFFYNIILGFFSGFMRILKGMILGVIFISRIDRTSLM